MYACLHIHTFEKVLLNVVLCVIFEEHGDSKVILKTCSKLNCLLAAMISMHLIDWKCL